MWVERKIPLFKTVPLLATGGWLVLNGLAGCSTLTIVGELHEQRFVSEGRPLAHIHAKVSGLYLFNLIPFMTGSAEQANAIRIFQHETAVERVVGMVTRQSQVMGAARLTDLQSYSDSEWQWWSLVFWWRWTVVSANASAVPEAPSQGTATPSPR